MRTLSLFEADRLTMDDSLTMTADSLNAYGGAYKHWALAYSGNQAKNNKLPHEWPEGGRLL